MARRNLLKGAWEGIVCCTHCRPGHIVLVSVPREHVYSSVRVAFPRNYSCVTEERRKQQEDVGTKVGLTAAQG